MILRPQKGARVLPSRTSKLTPLPSPNPPLHGQNVSSNTPGHIDTTGFASGVQRFVLAGCRLTTPSVSFVNMSSVRDILLSVSLDKQKRATLTERSVLVLCLYCYKYSLKDQMISNLRLCPGVRMQVSNVLRKCYITEALCDPHLPLLQEVDSQCNR
jgi:hypothetical protein